MYPNKRLQKFFTKTKIVLFSFTKACICISAWQKNLLQQNGTNSMIYLIERSTSCILLTNF